MLQVQQDRFSLPYFWGFWVYGNWVIRKFGFVTAKVQQSLRQMLICYFNLTLAAGTLTWLKNQPSNVLKKAKRRCKPGSVLLAESLSFILTSRRRLARNHLPRSTLRLGQATLKRRYTRTFSSRSAQRPCHHSPGGLLPHLLTLTHSRGRLFSSAPTNPHGLLLY